MKPKCCVSLIFLSLFFLVFEKTHAQSPNWLWVKGMGGSGDELSRSIAIDTSGNVYSSGYFYGTVDFDPGAGVFNLTSNGFTDIFILKLDVSGNFVWAKGMGGANSDAGNSIVVDTFGNVYTTGYFSGTTDFDPGAGVFNLTSAGDIDIFISKLDSSGNFVWVKQIGGTSTDQGNSIAVDAFGNVYTTGYFSGTVDFDPDTSVASLFNLTSSGVYDIFISKLDNSGNFVWARRMGGTNSVYGSSIALDTSANIFTSGWFSGIADFDPGVGTYNLTSSGSDDIFISKLNNSGNFLWAKSMGGTGSDQARSIVVDPTGNTYITGWFQGTADFNPGTGTFNVISAGSTDIFISKLDNSGNFVWAKQLGGTSSDFGSSIALDPSGSEDIYATGYFQATADFDPGAGVFNLISTGIRDIFISKLNSSGNFVWAKSIGGTKDDVGSSIALNSSNEVYLAGSFASPSITIGSTTITNTGVNTGDLFFAKLDTVLVTGISDVSASLNMTSIFPNPATNHLTITLPNLNKKAEVTITDITGKIIYKTTGTETQKMEINTRDLAAGIYWVRIQTAEFSKIEKLIIAR